MTWGQRNEPTFSQPFDPPLFKSLIALECTIQSQNKHFVIRYNQYLPVYPLNLNN
jgi:hypothetical protein